jgi:hypothetical protein
VDGGTVGRLRTATLQFLNRHKNDNTLYRLSSQSYIASCVFVVLFCLLFSHTFFLPYFLLLVAAQPKQLSRESYHHLPSHSRTILANTRDKPQSRARIDLESLRKRKTDFSSHRRYGSGSQSVFRLLGSHRAVEVYLDHARSCR